MVQVREEAGGPFIQDAIIELQPITIEDWARPLRNVATGRNGVASMAGLAPGRYRLRVRREGYGSVIQEVDAESRSLRRLTVRLQSSTPPTKAPPPEEPLH